MTNPALDNLRTYLFERAKAAAQVPGLRNSHIVVYADSKGQPSAAIKRTENEAVDMMMDHVGKNSWAYKTDTLTFIVARLEADPEALSSHERTLSMDEVRRTHEVIDAERRQKRSRFLATRDCSDTFNTRRTWGSFYDGSARPGLSRVYED